MSKLEKVIRGLRDIDMFIAGRLEHEKAKNFLRTIDETIILLKEQETQKFFVDEAGKITPLPVVVRCKDCKYWSAERINDFNKCRRWINVGVKNFATMGDWFCADGVAKDKTVLNK